MLTGEPKDALHQLRTRVCFLLVIIRGHCALKVGISDDAGSRARITHRCDPGSVPDLDITSPRTEPASHWWVIQAVIPTQNAIILWMPV